jgi:hypothetical protein
MQTMPGLGEKVEKIRPFKPVFTLGTANSACSAAFYARISGIRANPLKYTDPDGRENDEPTVNVIFYYVNQNTDRDSSFKRASETLSQGISGKVYMIGVTTETEFKEKWDSLNSILSTNSEQISNLTIFSHGDTQNLYFARDSKNDGSLTVGEISALTNLDFVADGKIKLNSCQSGSLKDSGISQVFANNQGVSVSGEKGYTSFSTNPRYYSRTSSTSSPTYLQAYDRGRNNLWGKGGAYPSRIYAPSK